MKKKVYQSVVATHFREHSSIYLFVVVLFLMGVIFGAIVVNSLTFSQKEDLAYYLSQFFGEVSNGKVAASKDVFAQSLFDNSKFIGMMGILGISIIGLPVILIVLFMKGLVIGFTVGFLVNQMGWNGFLLSFVSVLPQNFIIIPVFIITATIAVSISLKMIRRQFMKKISEPILPLLGRYALVFVVAGLFLVIAALFEAYISPSLMKTVIETVY
ncbi:MAG: stage II sporulation protein M [Bacillus sp. (in: firmicutes)]